MYRQSSVQVLNVSPHISLMIINEEFAFITLKIFLRLCMLVIIVYFKGKYGSEENWCQHSFITFVSFQDFVQHVNFHESKKDAANVENKGEHRINDDRNDSSHSNYRKDLIPHTNDRKNLLPDTGNRNDSLFQTNDQKGPHSYSKDSLSEKRSGERSSSPHRKKRKTSRSQSPSRKYSGSLPRKYSRSKSPKHRSGSQHSPAQWKMKSPQPHSRSRSPKCSTKSTSTGRKKNSYSPRHRDRSRSPKSPSRSEAYHHYKRPSNSTPNEKTILSSHQNKRSEYTPTSEENKVKETSDDVSTQGATGALASKAVRDLLRQGLGPRTKQYSDLTDEMVLVSCFEAVFFMKKCYKYQLVWLHKRLTQGYQWGGNYYPFGWQLFQKLSFLIPRILFFPWKCR